MYRYLLVFLVLILFIIYLFHPDTKNYSSYKYKIFYTDTNEFFIKRILGVIPNEYNVRFKEETIEAGDSYSLLNIFDSFKNRFSNYIVMSTRSEGEKLFIKGRNVFLNTIDENFQITNDDEFSKLHGLTVDLKYFNLYIECLSLNDKNAIKRKFCYILSSTQNDDFVVVDNIQTYASLLKEKYYKEGQDNPIIDYIPKLNANTIDGINLIEDNSIYCWFADKGLIKIEFLFKEDSVEVLEVVTKRIGIFGSEELFCC